MRRPLVAGNWKMNKTVAEARQLVSELVPAFQYIETVDKVLCPPFTSLLAVAALLEGTNVGLGAQDIFWESEGAFTGEISPSMVSEFCQYVIIGHSERRAFFGETDLKVNKRLHAALSSDLIPIVCIGETLEENESGRTSEIITKQMEGGLDGLDVNYSPERKSKVIIAYEPVWAIGTGRAATVEDAAGVITEVIRPKLAELFGEGYDQGIRVLYGGSVNGKNAAEFFINPDIDGALVGGASLKTIDFVQIVRAAGSI